MNSNRDAERPVNLLILSFLLQTLFVYPLAWMPSYPVLLWLGSPIKTPGSAPAYVFAEVGLFAVVGYLLGCILVTTSDYIRAAARFLWLTPTALGALEFLISLRASFRSGSFMLRDDLFYVTQSNEGLAVAFLTLPWACYCGYSLAAIFPRRRVSIE